VAAAELVTSGRSGVLVTQGQQPFDQPTSRHREADGDERAEGDATQDVARMLLNPAITETSGACQEF
jgi:hypothetical protein